MYLINAPIQRDRPTMVAALYKAGKVFARSNTGIVGSDPTKGMDVYV
jgi:hypothetical protein